MLVLANSLSRNVKSSWDADGDSLERETELHVKVVVDSLPATECMLERIKTEQECDHVCKSLKKYCMHGWPERGKLSNELRPYYPFKENVSYAEGYVLYNSRLVIPPSLQLDIINKVHQGHLGMGKCRERAKQSVWWLGLSTQSKNLIENCPRCGEERTNHKERFVSEEFPSRPWQRVSTDLFNHNQWYLILTDYYTRYIEVQSLKSMTELDIIRFCKMIFARFGIPEVVRSDNGLQFASEFKKFASSYDFRHVPSSPHYPQSNGCIEAAVKIAKNILKKSDDINLGLLAYRTTPLENGFSPAELMFSRKIRSSLPVVPDQLGSFRMHEEVVKREMAGKEKQAGN
ncbi:uncharacterized protein K02A2.6-like [Ceratina calcarata]|uniref:RNA-directed DNA polymerase n=1 Tax=Ceratina calcarata TaxID=156304 RepID=A0AAJ7NCS7_9HYME|nr:uncharacterized protein K02A2.6-like [Ceratina calcarata]